MTLPQTASLPASQPTHYAFNPQPPPPHLPTPKPSHTPSNISQPHAHGRVWIPLAWTP
ncbi:uncharacterized protein K452DRAFT_287472 [Aplosporella prunicola CBS 121167]|uniref:Uncharacterized protein n=1 Tax=Aplosporella prunicola CBS 121167 TaxID=1176127 RepID=A0A6A6BI68_9PEZI|nr:uncharacterized protein K452DRAFT_287472 [Aplosporella prunicola CBS 121167]KAF2142251.1 hypothetical protein K452DRAFT_287472 [Aplosporella prunicola CBS 121167]